MHVTVQTNQFGRVVKLANELIMKPAKEKKNPDLTNSKERKKSKNKNTKAFNAFCKNTFTLDIRERRGEIKRFSLQCLYVEVNIG